MSEKHHIIPVWFFAGVMFVVYGLMILVTGLVEWSNPPATVMASLHAPVWWGAILLLLGAFYCYHFAPLRS